MRFWPTIRVALFVAWRAIARGNLGVFLMTVAMMGAVFTQLVFVPSLIEGAKDQVERLVRDNITGSIAITPTEPDLVISDAAALVEELRTMPEVLGVAPTVLAGTQISQSSRTGSWSVSAVEPASYADVFTTPDHMIEGRFLEPGDNSEIVLGVDIAGADRTDMPTYLNSLKSVHVGDEVTVTMLGGATQRFTVVGIYDTGMTQTNQRAFVTRATAERALPLLAGQVSAVFVRTAPGDEAGVIDRIASARPHVTAESWQDLTAVVAELVESFDVVGAILGVVSLVVAVIIVLIVTYIDLVGKRRTIGIERAIGISGRAITLAYVIKAAFYAIVGAGVGTAVFLFVAVPVVDANPFDFPVGPVTLSATGEIFVRDTLILLVVSVVGALVPAWRTMRMPLLDAIWG